MRAHRQKRPKIFPPVLTGRDPTEGSYMLTINMEAIPRYRARLPGPVYRVFLKYVHHL